MSTDAVARALATFPFGPTVRSLRVRTDLSGMARVLMPRHIIHELNVASPYRGRRTARACRDEHDPGCAVRLDCSASAATAGCGRALRFWLLSSTQSTIARSDGAIRRCARFLVGRRMVESLKVRQQSGCRWRARRAVDPRGGMADGSLPQAARTSERRRRSSFPAFIRSFWQSNYFSPICRGDPARDSSRRTSMRRSTNGRLFCRPYFADTEPRRDRIVLKAICPANTIRARCASPQPSFGGSQALRFEPARANLRRRSVAALPFVFRHRKRHTHTLLSITTPAPNEADINRRPHRPATARRPASRLVEDLFQAMRSTASPRAAASRSKADWPFVWLDATYVKGAGGPHRLNSRRHRHQHQRRRRKAAPHAGHDPWLCQKAWQAIKFVSPLRRPAPAARASNGLGRRGSGRGRLWGSGRDCSIHEYRYRGDRLCAAAFLKLHFYCGTIGSLANAFGRSTYPSGPNCRLHARYGKFCNSRVPTRFRRRT